jgi:CRP-like cAMP-binding protein
MTTELGSLSIEDLRLISDRLGLTGENEAADLNELAGFTRKRLYRKGEAIYRQDDPSIALYAVLDGLVKIEVDSRANRSLIISWVGRGGVFGLSSFIDASPHGETATACDDAEVIAFQREPLLAYLACHPDALLSLVQLLAKRWHHAKEVLQDVVFLDIPGRLAKLLLELSRRPDLQLSESDSLFKIPSQSELALRVGATRVSVNKWLQMFAHQGWIELHRSGVRILDPDKLRERMG